MSPGPAFGRITSQNNLFNGIASGIGPGPSPQNQRNRALQRAFQSTTAFSVLASAGALPGAIAPQTPPDEKFLSLNRWRKPSGVLSRNWWWKVLSANELEIECLGF